MQIHIDKPWKGVDKVDDNLQTSDTKGQKKSFLVLHSSFCPNRMDLLSNLWIYVTGKDDLFGAGPPSFDPYHSQSKTTKRNSTESFNMKFCGIIVSIVVPLVNAFCEYYRLKSEFYQKKALKNFVIRLTKADNLAK